MKQTQRRSLKQGDVYPRDDLRDKHGMNSDNRPKLKVVVDDVPESLRQLISRVERWAISCDVTRADYFDQQPKLDVAF